MEDASNSNGNLGHKRVTVSRAEEGPWKGDSEAANLKGQKRTLGAFPLAQKEAGTGEEAEHQRFSKASA